MPIYTLVLGTWYLVLGTWYLVLGTWYLVLGAAIKYIEFFFESNPQNCYVKLAVILMSIATPLHSVLVNLELVVTALRTITYTVNKSVTTPSQGRRWTPGSLARDMESVQDV